MKEQAIIDFALQKVAEYFEVPRSTVRLSRAARIRESGLVLPRSCSGEAYVCSVVYDHATAMVVVCVMGEVLELISLD